MNTSRVAVNMSSINLFLCDYPYKSIFHTSASCVMSLFFVHELPPPCNQLFQGLPVTRECEVEMVISLLAQSTCNKGSQESEIPSLINIPGYIRASSCVGNANIPNLSYNESVLTRKKTLHMSGNVPNWYFIFQVPPFAAASHGIS